MGWRSWAVVAWLAVATVPAQGQVTLAWKLNQGDKFYLESVATQKQTIETMGQKIPISMKTVNLMNFEVLTKNADGGLVLRQVMEDIKIEGEGPAGAAQQDMAQKMKGATFTVTLDKAGRVAKLEGVEDLLKRLGGDNPVIAQMMKSAMNENALKETFQEIFAFVPDKPVRKGDSWKRDMTLTLGPLGRFKIGQQYTYEGPGKDGEHVSVKSTFGFEPSKDDGGAPFKVTKADFKAEDAKGLIVFDPKLGRVVRQDMTAKIKGSMTVSAGGQEVSMNLELAQDTKMRVLDKKP